jgi:hypothetical protein
MRFTSRFILVTGSLLGLAGCTKSSSSTQDGQLSKYDVNKFAVNRTACDPLGGSSGSTNPTTGLQASLYYFNSGETIYHDTESMIKYGHQSDKNLFFSEINVPTRLFSAGFPLQTGGMIQTDDGQNLIEYFALRFDGYLQLADDQDEGDYQLGILSDDGAIWSLSSDATGDNYQVVVNNDGDHPTQMGCGPIVSLKHGVPLRMQLDYYQGPRYEIAVMPLWRKVNQSSNEPLCGQNGNYLYFDPDNNSAPEAAWTQLQSRGWQTIAASNYVVPETAGFNPCTTGTVANITGFAVTSLGDGLYAATWTTDIATTDQVLYTDTTTGVQTLTVSDNVLRTFHSIPLHLISGDNYSIQAVSIAADLGKAMSAAVLVTAQ